MASIEIFDFFKYFFSIARTSIATDLASNTMLVVFCCAVAFRYGKAIMNTTTGVHKSLMIGVVMVSSLTGLQRLYWLPWYYFIIDNSKVERDILFYEFWDNFLGWLSEYVTAFCLFGVIVGMGWHIRLPTRKMQIIGYVIFCIASWYFFLLFASSIIFLKWS